LDRLRGYGSLVCAATMNHQQCLPGAPEPAVQFEARSPTKPTATLKRVKHSLSTPVLGGYDSRRWWRSSSTIVWSSTTDHSDFCHVSRGTALLQRLHACDMASGRIS